MTIENGHGQFSILCIHLGQVALALGYQLAFAGRKVLTENVVAAQTMTVDSSLAEGNLFAVAADFYVVACSLCFREYSGLAGIQVITSKPLVGYCSEQNESPAGDMPAIFVSLLAGVLIFWSD